MFTTKAGSILDDGTPIQLRGISHFGFNADILQPQHLWEMGWKDQLEQIKSLGFNAVRVPFVPDTIYSVATVDKLSYVMPARNAELLGKTPLQVLDLWMDLAGAMGLYVLLDFHSVSKVRQYPTWYCNDIDLMWNKRVYTVGDWLRDLVLVATRYAHLPKFLGIDIYNEPNGVVRWSYGDANMKNPANHWKTAAELAAGVILKANPKLLIFVQGITGNFDGRENSNLPMNWGENFQPQAYEPLAIPPTKLVLSPHTYGPDVFPKASFTDPSYPKNLPAQWETLFGQFANQCPVVPGEWGGRYGAGISASTGQPSGAADVAWQNAFVNYLISKGMRSSFYWCYTPNSGDTGGILDDQLKVRTDKLSMLRLLWGLAQPAPPVVPPVIPPPTPPSEITVTNGSVTITGTFKLKLN